MASSLALFIIRASAYIHQKLQILRGHMLEMQSRCDQVEAELETANSGTKYLLERAEGLRAQRYVSYLSLMLY